MDYAVREGEDASELAARLESTCQEATSGCVLVSSRRRALQGTSTLTATLSRPLSGGSLAKASPPHDGLALSAPRQPGHACSTHDVQWRQCCGWARTAPGAVHGVLAAARVRVLRAQPQH